MTSLLKSNFVAIEDCGGGGWGLLMTATSARPVPSWLLQSRFSSHGYYFSEPRQLLKIFITQGTKNVLVASQCVALGRNFVYSHRIIMFKTYTSSREYRLFA